MASVFLLQRLHPQISVGADELVCGAGRHITEQTRVTVTSLQGRAGLYKLKLNLWWDLKTTNGFKPPRCPRSVLEMKAAKVWKTSLDKSPPLWTVKLVFPLLTDIFCMILLQCLSAHVSHRQQDASQRRTSESGGGGGVGALLAPRPSPSSAARHLSPLVFIKVI